MNLIFYKNKLNTIKQYKIVQIYTYIKTIQKPIN